jgi:hypothetical protein
MIGAEAVNQRPNRVAAAITPGRRKTLIVFPFIFAGGESL